MVKSTVRSVLLLSALILLSGCDNKPIVEKEKPSPVVQQKDEIDCCGWAYDQAIDSLNDN